MQLQVLGIVEHSEADELMRKLQKSRIEDEIEDTILMLEHPEVVTIGPRARKEGIVIPEDYHSQDVDRGGGLTWHGPGQLVIYPIVRWREKDERSVAQIVNKLEDWVIAALAEHSIEGNRDERMQGVWVNGHKICSIGLSFLHWVSRHGLTVNLDTPPGRVEGISGCGLGSDVTTSLKSLGFTLEREEFIDSLKNTVESCLGRNIS